ncbi:hypothetical protein ACFL5O_10785, partial [Myxococcota bacterium]
MPEPPGDNSRGVVSSESLILICDQSRAGVQAADFLRTCGYSVANISETQWMEKKQERRPAILILNVDTEAGLDALCRITLRTEPAYSHVIAIGASAPELVLHSEDRGRITVSRRDDPWDGRSLLRDVEEVLGPRGEVPGTSLVPPSRWSNPPAFDDVPSGGPSNASGPELVHATPPLAARAPGQQDLGNLPLDRLSPSSVLSPELQRILQRAEQRLGAAPASVMARQRMSPEEELDAVLPPDLLAALDEALDNEDDEDLRRRAGHAGEGATGFGSGFEEVSVGTGSTTGSRTPAFVMVDHETTAIPPEQEPGVPPFPTPREAAWADLWASNSGSAAAPAVPEPDEALDSLPTIRPGANPTSRSTSPPALATGQAADSSESDPTPPEKPGIPASLPSAPAEPPYGPSEPPPESVELEGPPANSVTTRPPPFAAPDIPAVLGPGEAVRALARLVRARYTGALACENEAGIRRVVFRDGDFVTAASGVEQETLAAFLVERGAITADVAVRLGRRIPPFGRHAGAALIAHGQLRQDELWPILRGHAEWLIGRTVGLARGSVDLEAELPARLKSEPAVFGGATGAEVLVEVVRRVVGPETALARLGSRKIRLVQGRFSA